MEHKTQPRQSYWTVQVVLSSDAAPQQHNEVATGAGLIAAKLVRFSDYDRGDIKAIIKASGEPNLDSYPLTAAEKAKCLQLKYELSTETPLKDE